MKKFVLLGALCASLFAVPVLAHEADCPFCSMSITQDTPTQDNEVALKMGRKRIEYKCVYCALAEAQSEYKGDLSILAPSEKKGAPITLKRQDGKWTATPAAPFFVSNAKLKHKVCHIQARAFSSKAAAQTFLNAHKDEFADAEPLALAQMLEHTK